MSETPSTGAVVEAPEATEVPSHAAPVAEVAAAVTPGAEAASPAEAGVAKPKRARAPRKAAAAKEKAPVAAAQVKAPAAKEKAPAASAKEKAPAAAPKEKAAPRAKAAPRGRAAKSAVAAPVEADAVVLPLDPPARTITEPEASGVEDRIVASTFPTDVVVERAVPQVPVGPTVRETAVVVELEAARAPKARVRADSHEVVVVVDGSVETEQVEAALKAADAEEPSEDRRGARDVEPEGERRRIREDGELPHERFDPDAVKVVARLHQYGHEAYFVGGCVRDLILDRPPKDFDVATSATPNEVRNIFRNCRLIGRRFRLAHVYFKGGKVVEVSTFRANPSELEANAAGGGEGAEVSDDLLITHDNVFGTADEDARRRDFTMNGLFYDIESGTVRDFVNGRHDLDLREIRTIGDPEVRMREDPVRILRAVRFAAKLGLDIESRTYAAMEGAVEDLSRCAPARLLEETFRLLRGGYAETSLKLLDALDALRVLLPPLGEAIRAGGKSAATRCWAFARALDRQVQEGAEFDDSVLLAALLVPIATPEVDDEEDTSRQSVGAEVESLLAEFVQSARLPRRIAERSRQLLLAQRTLTGERRRRGGQAGFRRHPVFHDALRIFEMTVEATGEYAEALEAWKAGAAPVTARPDNEGEGHGTGAKRPRRRRGRRRGEGPRGEGTRGESAPPVDA